MANGKIISIDGMGGDHAPRIVVEGLERFAQRRRDLNFLLHGNETQLAPLMAKAPTAAARTTIRHTDKMISMDAKPADAVRRGKGSSMWNAIESVKNGEAMAAVSAGNTGALMGQSMLILKKAEAWSGPRWRRVGRRGPAFAPCWIWARTSQRRQSSWLSSQSWVRRSRAS